MNTQPSSGFEPLSGMDAGFLYMETPTLHMHTLKVAIVDPSDTPGGVSFEGFRRVLDRKLERLPSFKQRLMFVPLGLGHPVWVRDDAFEIDRHIFHRSLEGAGDTRAFNAVVSEIASTPLRRDRPLWEITLVDGLAGGRVAFVCKLHHSMADGAAALGLLLEALRSGKAGDAQRSEPDMGPSPSLFALARLALVRLLLRVRSLPALCMRTLRGLRALLLQPGDGAHARLPAPFSGPRSRWNHALTARRSFATTSLPMDSLLQIKRALGVTLNDVLLGICAGALRGHLQAEEGGVPRATLTASVPINTRPELVGRTRGNHVGHLSAPLCTHIADPVERIRSIHSAMVEVKRRHDALGADLMERWVEYAPGGPFSSIVRFWSRRRMADIVPAPVSLVVSNVAGPKEPIRVAGTRLESLYSVGPILEGIGLNITGWSYAGRLYLVGLGCPDQIPDVQALVDRLPRALEEVLRACQPQAAGQGALPRSVPVSVPAPEPVSMKRA